MKIFGTRVKIQLTVFVFSGLVFSSIIVLIWFNNSSSATLGAILGSLFAGLIVAIIQFIIAWQDYHQTDKLRELQLIRILLNRDSRNFYENYVRSAKKTIDMMGVTGSRFMEDFANDDAAAPENSKVLLQVMSKGVNVRILLPKSQYLFSPEQKRNEENANSRISRIKSQFQERFHVRYFSHVPAHSIFLVDNECIVGPVFPEVPSKFSPALHLKVTSSFAEKYLDYFNHEWNEAEEI